MTWPSNGHNKTKQTTKRNNENMTRIPTRLLFLEDTYLFRCSKVKVLSVLTSALAGLPSTPTNDKKSVVFLSETIFHPQGGGQPFDQGLIIGKNSKFLVTEVRQKGDEVQHIGTFETPEETFAEGEEVDLEIEEGARRLNARLHSAGHLLDVALRSIGQTQLIPGKGYHFPDAPYVEYEGTIDQKEREDVRKRLEQEIERLINQGAEVEIRSVNGADEIKQLCGSVPSYINLEKSCRVVTIKGHEGCPCGGTHVRDVKEIGGLVVPKITVRKNLTRIAYRLK